MTMDVGRVFKQYFEDHLLELHWKIRNVLAQKNSEVAVHIAEKERLEATNEILGEQIRRSAMHKDTESNHELAEKLNQINIKKKIIDDENVKLRTELMTLKHEKLRDEKISSDTISKLNRELKKLRYDLEKKSSAEETMKSFSDKFTSYKTQAQIMIESLNKEKEDKEEEFKVLKTQLYLSEEEIKILKKQLTNKELAGNEHLNNDESNGIKNTVFIKKISELSAESVPEFTVRVGSLGSLKSDAESCFFSSSMEITVESRSGLGVQSLQGFVCGNEESNSARSSVSVPVNRDAVSARVFVFPERKSFRET